MSASAEKVAAKNDYPFKVRQLTGHFGVEINEADISKLTDFDYKTLKQLFVDNAVMVLRNTPMDPKQQLEFTRHFGEIYITPYVKKLDGFPEVLAVRNRGKAETVTESWHHDASFQPEPAAIGILTAQILPESGGDTLFADMRAAYDALSPGMRRLLDPLRASHRDRGLFKLGGLNESPLTPELHPVVRTHPDNGRKAIYVSQSMVTHFEDMTPKESEPLLQALIHHSTDPEFVYRHSWRPGDVLLWDQRSTMHYAVHDHGNAERVLYRTTVAGDRPR